LEHRTAKSRYIRTNRKGTTLQLAQIERREARIRRIREKISAVGNSVDHEEYHPGTPNAHHIIGKSQARPENIFLFQRNHAGDPAAAVRDNSKTVVFLHADLLLEFRS
jgi:hypothetical protein